MRICTIHKNTKTAINRGKMKLAKVAQNFAEYCGEVYTVRGQIFTPKLAEFFSKNPLTNSHTHDIMTMRENTAKVQMKRGEHNGE